MKNIIMAYTVISVFPAIADTEEIKNDLKNFGFNEADIVVSKSRNDQEISTDNYQEDEQTKGFFGYVFAHDNEMLDAYSRQSVGKHNIIVYADNLEEAKRAKTILNEKGALEVYRRPAEQKDSAPEGMSEDEYNGIIAKARHNIYFLGSERDYGYSNTRGMEDEMDSLGSKD